MTLWELGLIVKSEYHDKIRCVDEYDRDARTHSFPVERICELNTLLIHRERALNTEITQIWISYIPDNKENSQEYYIMVAYREINKNDT